MIYEIAYSAKLKAIKEGRSSPLFDYVVFKQFKENMGGRCLRMISGGAPLSPSTQEFLTVAFGIPIAQGYGLTETCAAGTIQDIHNLQIKPLSVGFPLNCSQIKLVDVPDMGYLTTNKPPQGEVWIKGGNVTLGYYDDEKLTKESYTDDGWFKTGDVGAWLQDGSLSIIDRKKKSC